MKKKFTTIALSMMMVCSIGAKTETINNFPPIAREGLSCSLWNVNGSASPIDDKVKEIIAEVLGISQNTITLNSELNRDLGADSLDVVELVIRLEKEYGFEFSDNELNELETVGDVVTVIENKNQEMQLFANPESNVPKVKKNGKPSRLDQFIEVLETNGIETEGLTMETILPDSSLSQLTPQLKKKFNIRKDVIFPENANVSQALMTLMNAKYEKKNNKKANFFKIQYSLSDDDFAWYLEKYPNSRFAQEAYAKQQCTQQHEAWIEAFQEGNRDTYFAYGLQYFSSADCEYEGYELISHTDNMHAKAIESWQSLLESEREAIGVGDHVIKDCSKYNDYLEQYGHYSVFLNEAKDSLNVCQERQAWEDATQQNTLEAFKEYVENYPYGPHARFARNKVADAEAWSEARAKNTYSGYCDYYADFPEGDSVAFAIEVMKEKEAEWWNNTIKKNTLPAYDDFIDRFPKGYYSNEAKNKAGELRLDEVKGQEETISELAEMGAYSQFGYSYIGLANLDKNITMTVSLIGNTGEKVTLKHGEYKWVKVKNGKYKILVQAIGHENWWGNVEFDNHIYADGWYSTPNFFNTPLDAESRIKINQLDKKYEDGEIDISTWIQRRKEIIEESSYDKEALGEFQFEILMKVFEERAKLME